ncbi:hypothetical protein HmCmsJML160_03743 [Escherichia coli]|nr:hypothetical protein HmCmsJML087_02338 [Escherichia coli]GCZ41116.1 hypothetical protein HmCmsJML160_03743 [Escherichia coli]
MSQLIRFVNNLIKYIFISKIFYFVEITMLYLF